MFQGDRKGKEGAPGGAGGPNWGRAGDGLAVRAPAPARGPLDLSTIETNITAGVDERSRGYLVNRRDGKCIRIIEPWKVRARRCYRRLEAWAQVVMAEVQRGRGHVVRIGATLRPGVEWAPLMGTEFTKRVARELGKGLLGYCTVLEMQERGAAHFNFVVWLANGVYLPKPDQAGWWKYGSTSIKACRSVQEILYAARYVGKEGQKGGPGGPPLPKGAHLYSVVLRATVSLAKRAWLGLSKLPQWLQQAVMEQALVVGYVPIRCKRRRGRKRGPGGWWFEGRAYYSPWSWSREEVAFS